ncbi:MAG: AAA family ATPase, partial [Planctomycetota bacterium]
RDPSVPLPPVEIDQDKGIAYVLDAALPYNKEGGPLVPGPKKFAHFTIDHSTLLVLDKVATAVELSDPCLLEGETSTSKTSTIEYLAMRTNHQLVRLNLNGQTDTSELIGKFVPNDGKLQIEFENAIQNPDLLSGGSMRIVKQARSEARNLTMLESQKVAVAEGIQTPDWRWQDGIVPQAMKQGWWVILDEINLAEPQILERLNSVIERNPSLVMSEQGNTRIGADAAEQENQLHKNFRMFATMNPAEYSGRAAMSPAYKDRWTSYIYANPPGEADYLAMGMNTVYGEQPRVTVRGVDYQAESSQPLELIREVPNMRAFLQKLAKFEVKMEELTRTRAIGKNRKEKYTFTRRGLIELFEFLEQKRIVDRRAGTVKSVVDAPKEMVLRALQYYYLDDIAGEEDMKKVTDLMDSIGISEKTWKIEFTEDGEKQWAKEEKKRKKEDEPEPEEGEAGGRDAETFLNEAFDFIGEHAIHYRDREEAARKWNWQYDPERHLVNMGSSKGNELSEELIDERVDETYPDDRFPNSGTGLSSLLKELEGKSVTSIVDKSGDWYLRVH